MNDPRGQTGDTQALPEGSQIGQNGKLRIEGVLGTGGFGITYRAFDTALERTVAVKELFPRSLVSRINHSSQVAPSTTETSGDFQWALRKFQDEGKVLGQIKHQNIITVFDSFPENNTAYMVMELLEGQDLGKLLKQRYNLFSQADLDKTIMPLLDALRLIHQKGYFHRDIKPGNIFITSDGQPILIDFGAVKIAWGNHSQTAHSVLTPPYAPVEQYNSKEPDGPYTDLYALGVTAYEAVTGTKPSESTFRIREDDYRPLRGSHFESMIGPAWAHAIDTALQMEPRNRPQNAGEMKSMVSSPSVPATPPQHPPSQPPQTLPPQPGHPQTYTGQGQASSQGHVGQEAAPQSAAPVSQVERDRQPTPARSSLPWVLTALASLLFIAVLGGVGYFLFGLPNNQSNTVGTSEPVVAGSSSSLTATASSTSVGLSWDADRINRVSPSSYIIERSNRLGSGTQRVAEVSGTSWEDSSVQPGASYQYQVTARNSDNNDLWISNIANVTVDTSNSTAQEAQPQSDFERAQLLFRNNEFGEARKIFLEILRADAGDANAAAYIAACELGSGDNSQASGIATHALKLDPANVMALKTFIEAETNSLDSLGAQSGLHDPKASIRQHLDRLRSAAPSDPDLRKLESAFNSKRSNL